MNNMTREEEILTVLQEECAEVSQMVCKIRRFGIDETHLKEGGSNRERLTEEVGDLQAAIDLLKLYNVVDGNEIELAKQRKFEKLKRWSKIYET
jgi:NTP pyrophosphatase (non-canonical NTP hydrolase)